jgi:DNA-binding cell septation regulator SpoVG
MSAVELAALKLIGKGSLIALATVRLPIGLTIIDCPVFTGERGPWVALPSRPSLDRDGRQRVAGDRKQYEPVLAWPSRDVADAFSAAVLALIRERHPGALP